MKYYAYCTRLYTYTYRHGRQTRLQVVVVTRTYWRQQSFCDIYIIYMHVFTLSNYKNNIITNNLWHMPYKMSKYTFQSYH